MLFIFLFVVPCARSHNNDNDNNNKLAATLRWFTAAPKPQNRSFLGVTQPPGVAQPLYSRGHN